MIEISDTTLRDGGQAEGITFSVSDKIQIIQALDELGIGFVAFQSEVSGDIPFTMFYLVFLAVLTLLGNLIADILYAVVDPRVRVN